MSNDKKTTFRVPLDPRARRLVEKAASEAGMTPSDYATSVAISAALGGGGVLGGPRPRLKHWNESPEHERICQSLFTKLVGAGVSDITLFVFDFGSHGHLAFAMDLEPTEARITAKHFVSRAESGTLRVSEGAEVARDIIAASLPEGTGFACIFGRGEVTGYLSNAHRADVVKMLKDDVLPRWGDELLAIAREKLSTVTWLRDESRLDLMAALSPELREHMATAEARLARVVLPPATSAANVETQMMAWAYVYAPVCRYEGEEGAAAILGITAASEKLWAASSKFNGLAALAYVKPDKTSTEATSGALMQVFAEKWVASAYARLEVGHKLAASLCLTDVPDELEVRAPWAAWSLVLPDGILGAAGLELSDGEKHGPLARVWLLGLRIVCLLKQSGELVGAGDACLEPLRLRESPVGLALHNLIRGACLALSSPDDFKKQQGSAKSTSAKKGRGVGAPNLEQARFLLSAPVKVDFREHLREALAGTSTHASPKSQFLVRGHWRQQAHGPKHTLRKSLFIEPFWKGDPEARVLLRQHKAEG